MAIIVGNKVKGRISKRVFQENKAHQIFEKQTFFTPLYARVRTLYVYIRIFALLPTLSGLSILTLQICIQNLIKPL